LHQLAHYARAALALQGAALDNRAFGLDRQKQITIKRKFPMTKFSWRTSSLIAVMLAIGVATVSFANHSWAGYHWARTSNDANPFFTLKVGDNVSSQWDSYLNTAISDWSASSVLNLVNVAGKTRPRQCKPTVGQLEVCNERYGNNGWLGIAQIWVNGLHITQATTKLNDTYFNTATYNTPAWRQLVTCQEIAHDFGLDHQDENFNNPNLGSCMDYTSDPDGPPSNEHPNQHDYDQILTIYQHTDSTSTIAADSLPNNMPPAMGQIEFDTPAQWGKLVRSSGNGRVQVFELDFGRGHKVLTHVFWADPDRDHR
jgi:hypothetical protein